jgi:nucleoside phosphorylase
MQKDCNSLGCAGNTVNRRRCGSEAAKPFIHFGTMASANTVMKSGEHRDKIAEREGVIGFEMEGAGVWDNIPCIIIKGVCDYADSHKNKIWQNYAAATAASCTRSFLEHWMPKSQDG